MYQLHWANLLRRLEALLVLRLGRKPKQHDFQPLCKGCNCRRESRLLDRARLMRPSDSEFEDSEALGELNHQLIKDRDIAIR